MTEKIIVPKEELLRLINNKVQNHEGCEACKVSIYELADIDEDGNNWSIATARVTDLAKEIYVSAILNAIHDVKEKFNIDR